MACQLPHLGQMTGEDIEDFFLNVFGQIMKYKE